MSKKTFFWIFLIIGISWIIGVSILLINDVGNISFSDVKWNELFNSKDPDTETLFTIILIYIIPLIITALLFYFIGLLFAKNAEDNIQKVEKENENLKSELAEHVNQIETMKVLYTGGKIERKKKSTYNNKPKEIKSYDLEDKQKVVVNIDTQRDNLKIIEGIGDRIEFFLNESGIHTWQQLSQTSVDKLKDILLVYGGASYKIHNPSTWSTQATLADQKKWDELNEFKEKIRKS